MLTVDGLTAGYGDVQVLHDVDVEVAAGEAVAVIGANGAGKTTLLRTICGLLAPIRGSIDLVGQRIVGVAPAALARRGIAYVPADRRLFSAMTVQENLAVGAHPQRIGATRIAFVHGLFPRLAERRTQPAGTLSGGEQQMLAIGRALMSAPRLLLLDEPSTGLAPVLAREVYAALGRLRDDDGCTLVVAEQRVPLAFGLVDRVHVLENGRVVLEGTPDALRDDPAVRRAYLGAR